MGNNHNTSFPENNSSHNFYKELPHLNPPKKAHLSSKPYKNFDLIFCEYLSS